MAARFPDFDLYAELEVSERASVETIQAAYRSLQLRNHPDRVGPSAGERSARLNVAREWLVDPARRALYDAHLARLRTAELDDDGDEGDDVGDDEPDPDGGGVGRDDTAGPTDADEEPRPGLLHLLRRHLRLDLLRLGRIWLVGLAALGALALVPALVEPLAARTGLAALTTLVLVGLATGWRRDGVGLGALLARWSAILVGWALLALLAVEGVTALVRLQRGEPSTGGVADLALPALAVTAVLSIFAVRRRHGPVDTTVDEFLAMTPREFETAVGQILADHGYRLTLTGGPGDLAADLMGTDPDGRSTVVQCKRYAPGHPVGSRDVQMLIAMGMRHHDAEHLVLVTTSDFTDPARDLADEHDVELISGEDLEDLTR